MKIQINHPAQPKEVNLVSLKIGDVCVDPLDNMVMIVLNPVTAFGEADETLRKVIVADLGTGDVFLLDQTTPVIRVEATLAYTPLLS